MTGCYARRVGMHEDFTGHWVLIPRSRRGLSPNELTLPEALKAEGYITACIGKWHLGDQPPHLPTEHGFDEYFAIRMIWPANVAAIRLCRWLNKKA